ncbi:hypothetical protein D3C74_49130 [compost metagenome]
MKNLIEEWVVETTKAKGPFKGFLGWLSRGPKDIQVTLPAYDFLRAEVFVMDLKRVEDLDDFDVHDLFVLLLEDFVYHIRLDAELPELLENLKERFERVKSVRAVRREKRVKDNFITITVALEHETILRTQVLLRDLFELDQDFSVQIEDLLKVLVVDLVHELKRGSGKKYARAIMDHLERE